MVGVNQKQLLRLRVAYPQPLTLSLYCAGEREPQLRAPFLKNLLEQNCLVHL